MLSRKVVDLGLKLLFLLGELFDVVDEPEFGTTLGTLLRELSVVFEKRAVVFCACLRSISSVRDISRCRVSRRVSS